MAVKAKKKRRHINWKKTIAIYVMMLPGMLYFLFNNYLPMAGITIAFRRINYRLGIWMSPFCGLENFEFLFESGSVFIMIRNTILYNAVFIVLGTVLAIATAILLNEVRQKILNRTYQTLILLPYLMSMVVVSYLAYAFLSGENGYINNTILPLFGIDTKIAFYQEPKYWPFILTFVTSGRASASTWSSTWRRSSASAPTTTRRPGLTALPNGSRSPTSPSRCWSRRSSPCSS